ncbi:hypothetical protein QE152_g32574 [Popillia japonica]|uniref:Uncharacterized protein n=1 Tax=Popillia japonica TaxID=7064 RepID=A0AAW1IZ13_POPJA
MDDIQQILYVSMLQWLVEKFKSMGLVRVRSDEDLRADNAQRHNLQAEQTVIQAVVETPTISLHEITAATGVPQSTAYKIEKNRSIGHTNSTTNRSLPLMMP